jgi:uncharacterized protein YqeY
MKTEEVVVEDEIVMDVLMKYTKRSNVGVQKYGTTLESNNRDDFFKHLQEELMDATLYLEKLMSLNIEITKLVNETPNDAILGMKIRRLVM